MIPNDPDAIRALLAGLDPDTLEALVVALDEVLLDSRQVAERMGLSSADAMPVYRKRFPDFPRPVIDRSTHRRFWLPATIDAFMAANPRPVRNRQPPVTPPA